MRWGPWLLPTWLPLRPLLVLGPLTRAGSVMRHRSQPVPVRSPRGEYGGAPPTPTALRSPRSTSLAGTPAAPGAGAVRWRSRHRRERVCDLRAEYGARIRNWFAFGRSKAMSDSQCAQRGANKVHTAEVTMCTLKRRQSVVYAGQRFGPRYGDYG